jgi:sigma-B regulation protein RsbU (phosphoserine phosphatase)
MAASAGSVASREVGGDYYDITAVDPRCYCVVVADVSGKGVGSALLASLLQGALITATGVPEGLVRRIVRLNQFLLDRTGGEKYATLFYSLLHDDGHFSYVNAAQCPPIVLRVTGERIELEATGMPVGLMEGAEFSLETLRLAPGDRVVIYSDGVTEAQNQKREFFGKKRLNEILKAHAGESCSAIHEAILESVTAFTEGAPQSDDITVVVLEYRGVSAPSSSAV